MRELMCGKVIKLKLKLKKKKRKRKKDEAGKSEGGEIYTSNFS